MNSPMLPEKLMIWLLKGVDIMGHHNLASWLFHIHLINYVFIPSAQITFKFSLLFSLEHYEVKLCLMSELKEIG